MSNDVCAYSIGDDDEFDKILYEPEVDLLDGSLETNKANTDPGTTAESAVRPPTNRRRVSATLAVAEGNYGEIRLGWGSRQESSTCNTTMSNSPPQTGLIIQLITPK